MKPIFRLLLLISAIELINGQGQKILLYSMPDGKGQTVTLTDTCEDLGDRSKPGCTAIPPGTSFDNKARSARVDGFWVLYDDKMFGPSDPIHYIVGTDKTVNLGNSAARASSVRRIGSLTNWKKDEHLSLFQFKNFAGNELVMNPHQPTFFGKDGVPAQSAVAINSEWTIVTEHQNFCIRAKGGAYVVMDFRKEFDLMLEVILHIRHGCEINARNASNEFQPATVNVMHPLPPPSMNAKDGAVAGLELEPLNKVLPQNAFSNTEPASSGTALAYSDQGFSASPSITASDSSSSASSSYTPPNVTSTPEIPAFRPKRPLFMDRPPRPHQQNRWRQPNFLRNPPPLPPMKPGGSRDYDYPSYPGNNPPPMPPPPPGSMPGEDYGMPPPPGGNLPPNPQFRPRLPPPNNNPMIRPRQQNNGDMSNEQPGRMSGGDQPPPTPPPPGPGDQPPRFIGGPRNEKLQKLKSFYPHSIGQPPSPIVESPAAGPPPEDAINNEGNQQQMPPSNGMRNLPRQKFSNSNQGIMPPPPPPPPPPPSSNNKRP